MNPLPRTCAATAVAAVALAYAVAAQGQVAAPKPAKSPPARPGADLRAEPVPPAVDAAFRAWDVDHDDSLSLTEFRNGWRRFRRGPRQTAAAGLRRQFDRLDANDNSGLDRTEYPDMVLVKRAGELAPPFSEIDRNNDQKLDFAEYTGLVRRLQEVRAKGAPAKRPPSPK